MGQKAQTGLAVPFSPLQFFPKPMYSQALWLFNPTWSCPLTIRIKPSKINVLFMLNSEASLSLLTHSN